LTDSSALAPAERWRHANHCWFSTATIAPVPAILGLTARRCCPARCRSRLPGRTCCFWTPRRYSTPPAAGTFVLPLRRRANACQGRRWAVDGLGLALRALAASGPSLAYALPLWTCTAFLPRWLRAGLSPTPAVLPPLARLTISLLPEEHLRRKQTYGPSGSLCGWRQLPPLQHWWAATSWARHASHAYCRLHDSSRVVAAERCGRFAACTSLHLHAGLVVTTAVRTVYAALPFRVVVPPATAQRRPFSYCCRATARFCAHAVHGRRMACRGRTFLMCYNMAVGVTRLRAPGRFHNTTTYLPGTAPHFRASVGHFMDARRFPSTLCTVLMGALRHRSPWDAACPFSNASSIYRCRKQDGSAY